MRFPPPQTEFRILAFDPDAVSDSPERPGYTVHTNGCPFIGRLYVRGKLVGEVGLDRGDAGIEALQKQYAQWIPTFNGLVRALKEELGWPHDATLALAIAFVSPEWPERLIGWRFVGEQGRGRHQSTNKLTRQLVLLADAWWSVTGQFPRMSADTAFIRALMAAALYLLLENRQGHTLGEYLYESVQREQSKLRSGDFVMISPREAASN